MKGKERIAGEQGKKIARQGKITENKRGSLGVGGWQRGSKRKGLADEMEMAEASMVRRTLASRQRFEEEGIG